MNTSYAVVKLLRYDESIKSNNESVNSVSSNITTKIDMNNQSVEVKRSSRRPRKRTFQRVTEDDDDHIDNIKKKKCMGKKPQFSKTEPAKPIVPQKDTKKPKSPFIIRIKPPTENSLINSDIKKLSDTVSSSICVNDETADSMHSPLKTPQNKRTKSINLIKKNILANNVDEDDTSNESEKNEKLVPLKMPKGKVSKSSISIKKSPVYNVHKDNLSNELVKNDNFPSSKSPKNKLSKSNIPAKKRFLVNDVHKESISKEDVIYDNTVSLKSTKNKSKSNYGKKSFAVNSANKNNVSIDFEESDMTPSKTLKNKSSTKSTIKKRPIMNNIKKNDMNIEVEEKSDACISQKRGRPSLKKGQLANTNVSHICNDEIDSKHTTNMVTVLDKLYNVPKPELSKDPNDNMMMLRSNNKPPKIKKKWSEEWSGDKLLNNVLKFNNDDHLGGPKIDLNTCSKTIKKVMKTPKSKSSNYKKVKTKMLEKLDKNTNDSFSIKDNTSVYKDMSNTLGNISGTGNQDHLITTNIPFTESRAVSNDVITEPDNSKIITDVPFVCNETESINSSEVTTEPTACTESSSQFIEIPTTTELSNNVVSYENNQPSNLITSESIFDPTCSSYPMGYSESAEISYGIAILSEAISRQCRESNEESVKTKSSEQDINEIQSSSKKNNSSSRSQVPSAMVSPQRVNEHKNKSKKVVKYSSVSCEPSVQTDKETRAEREILLLSKRFNIPIESLRKTVIEEPLSVFHKKYSESITPSMITISPIVKDVETKTKPSTNYLSGNLDVEYKVEPIREAAAYEKTNLKDLMQELTKTMPSWSLSIVTNPSRYVISNMSINTYGVPFANKVIVLDKLFRASVYINQSLEHTYCKPYTTATEIVNLIKELNSL